ncbi:MAG: amidohydrolase family protein [Acidimicrobiales bacterium]
MIDHHAHPFDLEPGPLDLGPLSLDLDDGPEAESRRARLRPSYLWHELLVTRLARHLGCPPDDVAETRAERSADYRTYVRGLFADAGITEILMDPAWPAGLPDVAGRYAEVTGCRVNLLYRIDPLVDRLLEAGASFAELVRDFDRALDEARAAGFVGLKTIVAYRTGLAIDPDVTAAGAEASLAEDAPVRRRAKPLRDFLVRRALQFAADASVPLQVHTGFGDSDIRLAESNPLLLEAVLRTPEGRAAPVVLIHGGYPFHEEVAYLATARPNVHVDFSLFNVFAPSLVADRLLRLVELAPTAKLLAGTDGFALPETYWFAAHVARAAWETVGATLRSQGVRADWFERVTTDVFGDNARRLYHLPETLEVRGDRTR